MKHATPRGFEYFRDYNFDKRSTSFFQEGKDVRWEVQPTKSVALAI